MNTRINSMMCRCCASEGTFKDLSNSYHWMGEEEIYADMLKECFEIYLSMSEDGEDGGICEVCITQLRNAFNFKKQVQHTEKIFIQRLQDKLLKPDIVKVEVPGPDDDALESDNDHNVTEDNVSLDFEELDEPIKKESPVQSKAKKRVARTTTSRAKKAKKEIGESSTKRNLQLRVTKVVSRPRTVKKLITKDIADAKLTTVKTPFASTLLDKDCANTKPKKSNSKFSKLIENNKDELDKRFHNTKQILTHSNATPIRSCFGFYSCCYCHSEFEKPSDLKAHTLETHTDVTKACVLRRKRFNETFIKLDITGLKCRICQENINSVELLMKHLNSNHDIQIYSGVNNLIVPFKFDTSQFQCYICSTICHKFKALLQHMHVHYQNYICDTCSSGFITLSQLKKHDKTHQQITVKCSFCPVTFNDYKSKRSHEHSKHGASLLRYKCHYCDEAFHHYYSKEVHLRDVHGVTNLIECKACGKTYNNRSSYQTHLRLTHLMIKTHKCSMCEKSFFKPHMLRNHELSHTKIKSYECEICSKMYISHKTLRAHMKTHDSVHKFTCQECGRHFIQKNNYLAHLKSKHGDSDCA